MSTPPPAGPVVGVLLAAGEGRRLGAAKPLVLLQGRSLLERAIGVLVEGGCEEVVVVTGADQADVGAEAHRVSIGADARVHLTHNADWAEGQSTSLRAGLATAARLGAGWVVLHLVDLPGIGPSVIARLLQHRTADDAVGKALVAGYEGAGRNPVVLPADLLEPVAAHATGDAGARGWLRAHPAQVVLVECADLARPDDIDTPEQLNRWRATPSPEPL